MMSTQTRNRETWVSCIWTLTSFHIFHNILTRQRTSFANLKLCRSIRVRVFTSFVISSWDDLGTQRREGRGWYWEIDTEVRSFFFFPRINFVLCMPICTVEIGGKFVPPLWAGEAKEESWNLMRALLVASPSCYPSSPYSFLPARGGLVYNIKIYDLDHFESDTASLSFLPSSFFQPVCLILTNCPSHQYFLPTSRWCFVYLPKMCICSQWLLCQWLYPTPCKRTASCNLQDIISAKL